MTIKESHLNNDTTPADARNGPFLQALVIYLVGRAFADTKSDGQAQRTYEVTPQCGPWWLTKSNLKASSTACSSLPPVEQGLDPYHVETSWRPGDEKAKETWRNCNTKTGFMQFRPLNLTLVRSDTRRTARRNQIHSIIRPNTVLRYPITSRVSPGS
jgi:hypothetical protein